MASKFEITVKNKEVTEYLGIMLLTKLKDGSVKLTQPKLLNGLLLEYCEYLQRLSRAAAAPQRLPSVQSPDSTPMPQSEYLHLLGALI